MKKFRILLLSLITAISCLKVQAQLPANTTANIEVQGIVTTANTVPFWMRSNQYGSIPLSGPSISLLAAINKGYSFETVSLYDKRPKLLDWGYGFEARANAGKGTNVQLIEASIKARLSIFQLKIGRAKDVMGFNGDTVSLTSGNFAVSGNALGVPKVEISIPEYYTLPIFNGLISFKGNFSHGWLGRSTISFNYTQDPEGNREYKRPETYLHQKSIYGRLGRPNSHLKLYGGFSHQAFWGSEKEVNGPNFKLTPLQTFVYVATGKAYGAKGIPRSKIGNQIGSIDLGADYAFENFKLILYRQNFYDVGALSKLANIRDGLNGISIENLYFEDEAAGWKWKKILFEHFYTKDQAGYPWSITTNSGDEDYYNNYYYAQGWSYKGDGLGNPLITPLRHARKNQINSPGDYFINNRVNAWHLGVLGGLNQYELALKLTYSNNFGTFGTSPYGKTTGEYKGVAPFGIFTQVKQFSFFGEAGMPLKNNLKGSLAASFDSGRLLNNSFGLIVKIKKNL